MIGVVLSNYDKDAVCTVNCILHKIDKRSAYTQFTFRYFAAVAVLLGIHLIVLWLYIFWTVHKKILLSPLNSPQNNVRIAAFD